MTGVLRLSPWTRAPRLLWKFPVVWSALAATGALLGLALALPPLYLGSIASASAASQAAGRCTWTAGYQAHALGALRPTGTPTDAPELAASLLATAGDSVLHLDAAAVHLGPPVATLIATANATGAAPRPIEAQQVLYRTGAEQHVRIAARIPGDGVLLTTEIASVLGVRPGSEIHLAGRTAGATVAVRVVGTYQDLADLPLSPFWCSLDPLIHLQDIFGNVPPPPIALATSPGVVVQVAQRLDPTHAVQARLEHEVLPGLTIDQAERANRAVSHALSQVRYSDRLFAGTELPFLVRRAHAVQDAATPPIAALATGAVLAALGLTAVAGSFWAERRRPELDLLSARGVGPRALAGKAALECAPPLLLGLVLGAGISAALVVVLGPAAVVTAGAAALSATLVPLGALAAVAVLAAAVGRRLRSGASSTHGPRRSLGAGSLAVGEVILLAATLVALSRIGRLRVGTETTLPSFGLERLFLPLLALLLFARLALRLLVQGLRRLRGRGDGWPLPLLLATQRLASVPRVPAALAVVVAVASGTCIYSTGLADSLQRTVAAKATVFVGARTSIELIGTHPLPDVPGADRRTVVFALAETTLRGGNRIDVLGVDPATFARAGSWDPAYADRSLKSLMTALSAPPGGGVVPVLAVGGAPDSGTVNFGRQGPGVDVPFTVVGRARAFPGERTGPLLVVSMPTLSSVSPDAVRFSTQQIWIDGPPQPFLSSLRSAGIDIRSTTTAEKVSAAPVLEAVLQTLSALRFLGLLAAVLAAVGLLVYVDVRARRRRLAAVLTRRMGLHPRTDWFAGWLELAAVAGSGVVLGVAAGSGLAHYVAGLLDPLPLSPPQPLVVLPVTFAAALAVGAAVATALIAAVGLRRGQIDAAVLRAE